MKLLQINTAESSISEFLDQYQTWKDYRKFYKNNTGNPVACTHQSGIPYFHYTDVHAINQCQEPLVLRHWRPRHKI